MKLKEQQAAEVDTLLTPLFRGNTAGLADKLHQGEETEILISYTFILTEKQEKKKKRFSYSMEITFILLISYNQTSPIKYILLLRHQML